MSRASQKSAAGCAPPTHKTDSPKDAGGCKAVERSWRDLPEYAQLAQEQVETRMEDLEGEAEFPIRKLGMSDVERAGSEPLRQEQAPAEQLEEIILAAEDQCAFAGIDRQRHEIGRASCRQRAV